MTKSIKHISFSRGHPRFNPGPALVRMGYKSKMLKTDDGTPFTAGEALDWSNALCQKLESQRRPRKVQRKNRRGAVRQTALYSVADLFADWFENNPLFTPGDIHVGKRQQKALSPNTLKDYRQKSRVIEQACPQIWQADVAALDTIIITGMFERIWQQRGLATANGCVRTLSSAISWARKRRTTGLLENPAKQLNMPVPETRPRFASKHEIRQLIEAADLLGLPEIGDGIALGLWTAQRQGDRLALIDQGLVRGRRRFRQSKTGALVAIKQAPELEARLNLSRKRREQAGIVNPQILLDETSWQAFSGDRYRKQFARVRRAAVEGIEDQQEAWLDPKGEPGKQKSNQPLWLLEPTISLTTFREKDLRATGITWMALAGVEIPGICAVSGHSIQSAANILKHYLVMHPEMADSAIDDMVKWYLQEGDVEQF